MIQFITPTAHDKAEWSRMAQAAYAANLNSIGHRYSGAAACPSYGQMSVGLYDKLQTAYRAWLVGGFGSVPLYTDEEYAIHNRAFCGA